MNFQVTVLKILVSYPGGFATMEDLKRDMAILATSGRDWTDRTRRLGARVPGLDIFSQALIERSPSGWRITEKGRAVLEVMEVDPPTHRSRLTSHPRNCNPLRSRLFRFRWKEIAVSRDDGNGGALYANRLACVLRNFAR